jgi:hypothetical protein
MSSILCLSLIYTLITVYAYIACKKLIDTYRRRPMTTFYICNYLKQYIQKVNCGCVHMIHLQSLKEMND